MNGFRIGRILGFTIRVDFSWFIVFFLILWTFSVAVFPRQVPNLSTPVYLAMAVTATVIFFSSLLAHELSHSIVARRRGIRVEGITLFIFGGVAQTHGEPETAQDEFAIAGIGPLTSVAIGILLIGAGYLLNQAGASRAVTAVLGYTGVLNIILAVFNLMPGFPLDGGRLFRAFVWKITGDPRRATRIASAAGSAFGFLLVALGFLQVFQGALVGGLWLVFIGWFLRNAAIASWRHYLVKQALQGVRAEQVMSRNPVTVPPDLSLEELTNEYLLRQKYVVYPVLDGGTSPIGVIGLAQVREVPREEWSKRRVRDTMTPVDETNTVRSDDDVDRVMDRLSQSSLKRVLVVDDGELVGIISPVDIAQWLERARLPEAG